MFKFKNFSLVTVMIVILFIIGVAWAIPVQASNSMMDRPTEEDIKGVIQSYFEIRYHSFNKLKLDDFGDLIGTSAEAVSFLQSEQAKLDVEIRHAKKYRLGYSQYQFFLDFKDISIDTTNQTATVTVAEGSDVVYEISNEISPTEPIVSSMRNLQHSIVLYEEQGKWKIVSDYYEDYLWRILRETDISTDELILSINESPSQTIYSAGVQAAVSCGLPDDASSHPYNREGAVAYANHWAEAPRPYNSPPYDDFTDLGGDCTNFVSQAIHEGGNAPMVYYSECGDNCIGTLGWFYTDMYHRANAWNDVTALYDFITQYRGLMIPMGLEDPKDVRCHKIRLR